MSKPTDDAIVLALITLNPEKHGWDGWYPADAVACRLTAMGFEVTAQQAASWLARLAREEVPMVERRTVMYPRPAREYRPRFTAYNQLENRGWRLPERADGAS